MNFRRCATYGLLVFCILGWTRGPASQNLAAPIIQTQQHFADQTDAAQQQTMNIPLAVPTAQATSNATQAAHKSAQATPNTTQATPNATQAIPKSAHATTPHASAHAKPEETHVWNLQDADIRDVIEEVARETGENFLVDPKLQGKVTIISAKPLSSKEIYRVFLSMLDSLGYNAIPSGNIIKILPNGNAKQSGPPMMDIKHPKAGDQLVVAVMPIENVNAGDLVPILRPMMPPWADIAAYSPSNSLILSSTAANINRIAQIVRQVDKVNTKGIEVIPLHHANAKKLATVLNSLQLAGDHDEGPTHVILAADEETNSILMSGTPSARLKMRVLVSRMDVPSPSGTDGNTRVIYLHYQNAKKLAPILAKIAGSYDASDGSSGSESGEGAKKAPSVSSVSGGSSSKAIIAAEPSTNTIIITAPPTELSALVSVVHQLDQRPAEVLIEAIIVEVNEGVLKRLGVQWGTVGALGNASNKDDGDGDDTFNNSDDTQAIPKFLPYTGIIKLGSSNFRTVFSVLMSNNSSDLLSTPSIVALDNQKAKIEVGQQISIATGSYQTSSSGDSDNPFTTTDRQDVGLSVEVTPHISRNNVVQLVLNVENDTLQNPEASSLNPNVNTSGVKTSVLINSGDILVIGGLISNDTGVTQNKMPILGDIPGVGWLFKWDNHSDTKQNLMIFIRPIILRTPKEGLSVSAQKYDFIREQQLKWLHGDKFAPTETSDRLLPYWGKQPTLPEPFSNKGKNPTGTYYANNGNVPKQASQTNSTYYIK